MNKIKLPLTIIIAIFTSYLYAQPGIFDDGFGQQGIMSTDSTDFDLNKDRISDAIIHQDGKIIVGGGHLYNFGLTRYLTNGSLDSTFGQGGKVITSFFGEEEYIFALARYHIDGSLDKTFGIGGKASTAVRNTNNGAYAVVIQADGKILLGGFSRPDSDRPYVDLDFTLVRYQANGTLDSSFKGDGIVTTAIRPFGSNASS